jgi:hypothetical protein
MTIEYEDIATFDATNRVRFVIRRVVNLPHEYHIEKQVRDAFGGTQWFGAIYQCEQSEDVARMVAQSCAASYGSLHPHERQGA